ncbi:Phage tail protein [compost metagenome]
MAIATSQGAKIFIGPTTPADTEAEYVALTWVEVGEVETLGEFGDSAQAVTFTSLGDGRVRKLKGAYDAGDLALTVANDPADLGQIALVAASKTKFSYAFKVVLADAADETDTDSIFFFHGKVMTRRINAGGANDVTKRSFTVAIDTEVLEVPSEVVP